MWDMQKTRAKSDTAKEEDHRDSLHCLSSSTDY